MIDFAALKRVPQGLKPSVRTGLIASLEELRDPKIRVAC